MPGQHQLKMVRPLPLPIRVVLVAWLISVCLGMAMLTHYSATPNQHLVERDVQWPNDTSMTPSAASPTLIMFLHPRCPCSQASVAELGRVVASHEHDSKTQIVLYCPSNQPAKWTRSRLRTLAEQVSPQGIVLDRDGMEAKRFGVRTSGHVLLFSKHGKLRFSGGITAGRGHEGENPGRKSLEQALLNTESNQCEIYPVFGCSISE